MLNNHRRRHHDNDYVTFALPGRTGPPGPSGLHGATGPCCPGLNGPTGYLGFTGPNGFQGFTGPRGFTGATGVGLIGSIGPTGATGFVGFTGPSISGATGPSGIQGLPGATGPIGATGLQGYIGFTGPGTGSQGPTGYAGATGICCQNPTRTLFVDPNFAGTDNVHFPTITDALNYAPTLNPTNANPVEIIIYAGYYSENISLVGNVNLTGYNVSARINGTVTWNTGFATSGSETIILQNIFCQGFIVDTTTKTNNIATLSFYTCNIYGTTITMRTVDFFNVDNDCVLLNGITIYGNSNEAGPTINILNSTIDFISIGNSTDDTTNGIIQNVYFSNPILTTGQLLTIDISSSYSIIFNNCSFNNSNGFDVTNGLVNFNECDINIDGGAIDFSSTTSVTINNSSIIASTMSFGNINAYNSSFTTTGNSSTFTITNSSSSSMNNRFTGANNTFNDSGQLTTGPFITHQPIPVDPDLPALIQRINFTSPNSTFNISGNIGSGTVFNILSFYTQNSLFNIPNLNSTDNSCLFIATGTIDVSNSNFTISGTTNQTLLNVNYSNFIGRNCTFDCDQMATASFANISQNEQMDISNSFINFSSSVPNSGWIIYNSGTLIAPNCTINNTQSTSTSSPIIISNNSELGPLVNIMNCTFEVNNSIIISGGIVDVNPFIVSINPADAGSGSINFTSLVTYNDTEYSATIVPNGFTITSPPGPYISTIDVGAISYYVPQSGEYNIVITRQNSSIFGQ
jgi:hypothetical protein